METTRQSLDVKTIDRVIEYTMAAISDSREQMYDIAEQARHECLMLEHELRQAQRQVEKAIQDVDNLSSADRSARDHLVTVSREYHQRSYDEIQEAHEEARRLHGLLEVAREREKHLRLRRDDLARRLRNMKTMADRAETMMSRVGLVMDYLAADWEDLSTTITGYHRQQEHGFAIIRAQEEERRRLARDIHDGPAQTLAGLVMKLDYCQRLLERDPTRLASELEHMTMVARQSLRDVRKTIFDLRPMALDDLGLEAALKGYVAAFRDRTNIVVDLELINATERLTLPMEIAIFRIVQEALLNVHKHAATDWVCVHLDRHEEGVCVRVEDQGRGFDVGSFWQTPHPDAFGLVGMRERVEMLRGSLELLSCPGEGTRIICHLPLTGGEAA